MLGGVLLFVAPLRAADPTPIACPNGQTVFLEGRTIPREALLVYLADRAVGGGLSDSGGAFRLPLRADERPGSYPVEVRLRAGGAVVARFTCFVDIPVGEDSATPTQAPPPAGATPTVAATQSAGPTRAASATPGRTTTSATSTSRTATSGTRSPTPTGPTATASTTGTAGPSPTTGATITGTPAAQDDEVAITYVQIFDPEFPDDPDEYVEIENRSDRDIALTGWRLRNASRSNLAPYVFPQYVLEVDNIIVVYSHTDDDDPDVGDFFWDQSPPLWQVGDRAELLDPAGNVITSYVVEPQ